MVVPAELIHAQYAQEVMRFLLRTFREVSVRMFQQKMFPHLSEDTLLLLCDDYGTPCTWFSVHASESVREAALDEKCAIPVDIEAVRSGGHRLTRYLLPPKARHLYERLAHEPGVERLGDAADVGIGYVTGCNDYFHLTESESVFWRIPRRFLVQAALSLGDFQGTVLGSSDWRKVLESGQKAYLLRIPQIPHNELPTRIREYVAMGKRQGVHQRFKCRVRDPWYSVPHVTTGDAFLSYMSGSFPKLVANRAKLVAPNTLHIVRFKPGRRAAYFVGGWYSSLTRLSCEIEGHPLGGGMLKLEPSEAEKVLVALPQSDGRSVLEDMDYQVRSRGSSQATLVADQDILRGRFGLSSSECLTLRDAAKQLEDWRMHR